MNVSKGSDPLAPKPWQPGSDEKPWLRRDDETDKSWHAFTVYRDLGPQRTMRKASAAMGKSMSHARWLERWSRRYSWQIRVLSWDRFKDHTSRSVIIEETINTTREQIRVANQMWQIAAKGLALWDSYLTKEMERSMGKRPKIRARDVKSLAEAGIKLSQLLEGKPTDITDTRSEITVLERRKELQRIIQSPKIRAVMREITEEMESEAEPVH